MKNDTVKLGLMPPLSGIVQLYGQEIVWAAQIACDEINERGGVLGRPIELIIEDDGSLPDTAVPAAMKLVDQHKCVAIIGNLLSNSRIAIADRVAEPKRIPYLNFSFYEGSIFNRYFFHFSALPNQQIEKMIPYMRRQFGPKMFFAGQNYEWPRGSIDAAKRVLLENGGEIVGEEYFDFGTEQFHQLLSKIARSGANVFVPYAAGQDQLSLLTQFSEAGLKERMKVVMGHYDEAMVSQLAPHIREGFYSSNTYFMNVPTERNRRYLERLKKMPNVTGIWPNGNGILTNFGEGTYLCVHAFAKAAEQAKSLDAEALVNQLETISVDGPQGTVIMDRTTHHAEVNTYLTRCESDGTFTIIESFGRIKPIIPERYRSANSALPIETDIPNRSAAEKTGIVIVDGLGRIEFVNTSGMDLLEINSSESANGKLITDYVNFPVDKVFDFEENLRVKNVTASSKLNSDRNYGVVINVRTTDSNVKSGFVITFYEIVGDATKVHDDAEILQRADVGIVAINEQGEIIKANAALCKVFGYPENELDGLNVSLLLPPQFRRDHEFFIRRFFSGTATELPMGRRGEITGYRKNGSFFPAEASLAKYTTSKGQIAVASIRDVTVRKKEEEYLLWAATHDQVTNLPNRTLIQERIVNALTRSSNSNTPVGLMFVDLDEFKMVNDNYGHAVGDGILVEIGMRLVKTVKPGDTVARFGGDEFLVLCDEVQREEEIFQLADDIIKAIKRPFDIDGNTFYQSASIGVALSAGGGYTAGELLQNADAAMYEAKKKGRDNWTLYTEDIGKNIKNQLRIANGLRKAIDQNELFLVYQPIVDVAEDQIIGAEALLRWKHRDELISPAVFIPVAEMTGSINKIGLWVFEQSCVALQQWTQQLGESAPYVSINLSEKQLTSRTIVDDIRAIVNNLNVDTRKVILEITETTLMADIDRAQRLLNELGLLGLQFAIDDFGTGYSSLSRITQMPVNVLKVDKAFVDEIERLGTNRSVTDAIIRMAHSLGLKVTAEGVEREGQLKILKSLLCNNIQGYLISKPIVLPEFISLVEHYRRGPYAERSVSRRA